MARNYPPFSAFAGTSHTCLKVETGKHKINSWITEQRTACACKIREQKRFSFLAHKDQKVKPVSTGGHFENSIFSSIPNPARTVFTSLV